MKKKQLVIFGSAVLGIFASAWFLGQANQKPLEEQGESASVPPDPTVLAARAATTGGQSPAGRWEYLEGDLQLACTGGEAPLNETRSVRGKTFDLKAANGAYLYSDEVCSYELKGAGGKLEASVDSCKPSQGSIDSVKILKHSLTMAEPGQSRVDMKVSFEVVIPGNGHRMVCFLEGQALAKKT